MMTSTEGMRVVVADLVKRVGASRDVVVDAPIHDFSVAGTALDSTPVHLDLHLERIAEGIVVRGLVSARWVGECPRCLTSVAGSLEIGVDELFEPEPVDGETYRLEAEAIDLELLARDAIGLEIPFMPLCRDDCAGICPQCGADRNESPCECRADETDLRWAALGSLLDEADPETVDPISTD